ncbi:MAG: alpha-2-macroglobulin family protein [Thermoplasmata archaeon]
MRKAVARLVEQDRKRRFIVTLLSVLVVVGGIGVAVHNVDDAYLASKINLVTYVPDRVTSGGSSTIMVFAVDSKGDAMAGQDIDVVLEIGGDTELAWSGRTGEDGSAAPAIEFPAGVGRANITVRSGFDTVKTTTVLDDSVRIVITTDKPVYKPGDILHMRFLSYAGADPLPQESELLAEVYDPNGDKIFKKLLSPDEYGICSYDLWLSDQLNQGTYTISATVGERTVTKALTVKDYVLPKFRVDLLGVNEWCSVTDQVNGTISAEYFFGEMVEGTVALEASVYLGVWSPFYTDAGTLADGEYSFIMPAVGYAVGLESAGGNGYIQLNITVTDTAGHVERRYKVIPVAQSDLVVSVLTDSCVEGQVSTFHAIVRTPDGSAVDNATVKLYLLDGNQYGLCDIAATDGRGVARLTFTYDGETNAYVCAEHDIGSGTLEFDMTAEVGLKVVSDKSSYEVGETADFDIVYAGDSMTRNVYWDLVSRGYLLDRGVVQLEDGRASLQVDLGPDAEPFAQLRVYKIEEDMGVSRDAVTFSVGGSSMLTVDISADNSSYYPRDEVGLSFYVENGGAPTVAALGVSVVDEAVYEVGSIFQGFEEIVFGLDSEFIIPQYQVLTYVYGGVGTLPSESDEVIYEMDEARVMSTWPDNLEAAGDILDDASRGFWFGLYLCFAVGLMLFVGTRPRRVGGKKVVIAAVVALVLVGAGFAAVYVMTMGFGTSSSSDAPRFLPDGADDGAFWEGTEDMSSGVGDIDFDTAYGDEEGGDSSGTVSRPSIVRQYFPETWCWEPCLQTGGDGYANISLTAPDSITSWQVDVIASTSDGTIGTGSGEVTVFQPFFVEPDIPLNVVRGDEFPLKIMIYNYLDTEQTVNVSLVDDPWFTLLSSTEQTVVVPANYVTSVSYDIVADKVGWHTVTVSAASDEASDAVVRAMEVVPDGKRVETLFNGEIGNGSVTHTLRLAEDMIENSTNAWVKIQGSVEAVLLEGVDEFIRYVSGCGEQSLSVLSIDILAYATVMKLGTSPEDMFTYESIVNQGIQHELTYLVDSNNGEGRGIVWFPGDQDVHPWLTSWGLIAFQDAINAGFGLDEDIITDMQNWLMSIQQEDGSWEFPEWGIYDFNNPLLLSKDIAATGYIARALLHSGVPGSDPHIQAAIDFVEGQISSIEDDPFSLSLSLLLLQAGDGSASIRDHIGERLETLKVAEGDAFYWTSDVNLISDSDEVWTWSGSSPRIIETTGYAAMALNGEVGHSATVDGAVKYLLDHRGELGGWMSTQDTVVAFHALADISTGSVVEDVHVEVLAEGTVVGTIDMGEFNKDVTYLFDLRPYIADVTDVTVSCAGEGSVLYSVYLEQYVPWPDEPESSPYLTLTVTYDATSISVDDRLLAHMYLLYDGDATMLTMVLVDLRAPLGFAFDLSEFEALDDLGVISSYDCNDRQVIVYIMDVMSGVPVEFDYSLVAELPIESTLQGVVAWDMYNPEGLKSETLPVVFEVSG